MTPGIMRKTGYMAVLAAAAVLALNITLSGNTTVVKSVTIIGLQYMTKAEVLQGVKMKGLPGGIAVDLDSLRDSLAKQRFIQGFDLNMSGDSLKILVKERVPARLVLLRRGEESLALELDGANMIISVNRVHRPMAPLYIIGEKDIAKGTVTPRIKRLFGFMEKVKTEYSALYREIESVNAVNGAELSLRLKGRRTRVTLAPDMAQFARLQGLLGYLDNKGNYPALMALCGDRVLVRQ